MNLEEGPFVFRINDNGSGPNLLIEVCLERGWKQFCEECLCSNRWNLWWKTQAFPVSHQKPLLPWQVCTERGWREYTEGAPAKDGWNLWWKTSAFSVSQHKHLKAWQFTNHIPKGASICRKDNLARNLKCMRKVYGAVYDISPLGYNLPLEYTKLVADCSRREEDEEDSQKVWICKPVGQSQGRGIFLFKSLSDLCYDSNAVVQRYIKNPLLIGGYKFDLRLYVCVPSYHPLTIYMYKEGLVRFSTDKFSLSDLNNPFCHLTNSSLNKLGPGYAEQKDRIGAGCKWSFKQLRQYFAQAGIRDWLLWQKVSALVILTVLSQSTSVPQTTNCFEFYGFDVLVDEKLKPWLLEVNLSPALGNDCDVDPVVKKPLLHDLFDLLGLPVCNTGLSMFTVFLPFEGNSHCFNTSSRNLDNEGVNGPENRSVTLTRGKQKSAPSVTGKPLGNRLGIGGKPSTSSAIMVATAATRWRRKRRSSYLFGPPVRNTLPGGDSLDSDGKACMKQSASSLQLSSDTPKEKECSKGSEKGNEGTARKKSGLGGKRNREKDGGDKPKAWRSTADVQSREKLKEECHAPLKVISCMDNLKAMAKAETDGKSKRKKKIEVLIGDSKHGKCRAEHKSIYAYERPKKTYPGPVEGHTKSVTFPLDKSHSVCRGFKGRAKQTSTVLWGNGRDWRTPIHREGDWSRIYPFNNFNSQYRPTFEEDYLGNKLSVGDKQIRLIVHHVTNFIKVSKQIYCKGIQSTEEELSSQLINHLGMTGDVWLPSK